jgi:hypothetical protein
MTEYNRNHPDRGRLILKRKKAFDYLSTVKFTIMVLPVDMPVPCDGHPPPCSVEAAVVEYIKATSSDPKYPVTGVYL